MLDHLTRRGEFNLVRIVYKRQCLCLNALLNLGVDCIVLRCACSKLIYLLLVRITWLHAEFFHDESFGLTFSWRFGYEESQRVDAHLLKLLFVFDLDQKANFFN